MASFGTSQEDLKIIYILFIRSLLDQSATVWHSSLTDDDTNDLERVQKCAMKIIFQEKYKGYKYSLNQLGLLTLSERREQLCLSFALKCVKHPKLQDMFPLNNKTQVNTRYPEKYKVQYAHTERLNTFSVVYMQNLLNQHEAQMSSHA